MNRKCYGLAALLFMVISLGCGAEKASILQEGAEVKKLAGGFRFTEGPASDTQGNIYFSDIPNNRIHKWSLEGVLSTFLENSGGANGLFFDKSSNLVACEGKGATPRPSTEEVLPRSST